MTPQENGNLFSRFSKIHNNKIYRDLERGCKWDHGFLPEIFYCYVFLKSWKNFHFLGGSLWSQPLLHINRDPIFNRVQIKMYIGQKLKRKKPWDEWLWDKYGRLEERGGRQQGRRADRQCNEALFLLMSEERKNTRCSFRASGSPCKEHCPLEISILISLTIIKPIN